MELISVIVPIYKVEKYLTACIKSIINQTYTNLEIILVNDGSPDSCGEICNIFAQQDQRIKVINKANGGLSDARNAGLEIMTGKYVTFMDGDDKIRIDHIEYLYNLLKKNNADVSITTLSWYYEGEKPQLSTKKNAIVKVFNKENALKELFYQKSYDTSACGKLYLSSLFSNIRYPKGLLYEDLSTTYRIIDKCQLIAFSNYNSYLYLLRKTSIEGSIFSPIKFESCIHIIKQLESEALNYPIEIQKAIHCRIVSFAYHILLDIPKKQSEYRKKLIFIIKKYRFNIIINPKARKKTRLACVLSLIGQNLIDLLANKGKSRI